MRYRNVTNRNQWVYDDAGRYVHVVPGASIELNDAAEVAAFAGALIPESSVGPVADAVEA